MPDIISGSADGVEGFEKRAGQKEQPLPNENLFRPIEDLDLSVRSAHCLQSAGLPYVGELIVKTEPELLRTKNFGRQSLNEIKNRLHEMELELGMHRDEIPAREAPDRMRAARDERKDRETSGRYPPNLKGGRRPWENPSANLPKVGDGVVGKQFSLEARHVSWLLRQGNQSSYIRALIDADIMARSLPQQYRKSFENIRNAVMNALDESLTKELRQDQQDQDGAALSDPTKNQS